MPISIRYPFSGTYRVTQTPGESFSHASFPAYDFGLPLNTAVLAVAPGRVVGIYESQTMTFAPANSGPYGNFVTIIHNEGTVNQFYASYLHLKFNGVEPALQQIVNTGDVIGYSGQTGMATGPHLHFEFSTGVIRTSVGTGDNGGQNISGALFTRGGGSTTLIDFNGVIPADETDVSNSSSSMPSLSVNDITVDENTGTATFTVSLSAASSQTVSVLWTTLIGTANQNGPNTDYNGSVNNTLTFTPGQTSRQVSINLVNDNIPEGTEYFDIFLQSPTNATILDNTGRATVTDSDAMPVTGSVSISDVTITEGNNGTQLATFTVTRTGGTAAFSVNYATSDGTATTGSGDYNAATGSLNFGTGVNTQQFSIAVNGDTLFEGNETFFATLNSPTNGANITGPTGQATIQNDDSQAVTPTISIAALSANQAEGNSGTTAFTFIVSRSGDASGSSSVDWSINSIAAPTVDPADFSGTLFGSISFAPGETSKVLTVNVIGDTVFESNENFTVSIGSPVGASIGTSVASAQIQNDDASVPVTGSVTISDVTITEGNTGTQLATFTVTRTGGTAAFSVNYATSDGTATTGSGDYNAATGTLNFGSGVSTQTFSIVVNGDTLVESSELFFATLNTPTNGAVITDATGQVTIQNDDVQVGQNTITLKPGSEGVDVWINSAFSPFGADDGLLRVGGWGDIYDSLIKFDLPTNLTQGQVTSATLRMYNSGSNSGTATGMNVDIVNTAWDESYRWGGGNLALTNLATTAAPALGWIEIDVSSAVAGWLSNPSTNFGLQFSPLLNSNNFNFFISSDAIGELAQYRPELVLNLNNAAANAPEIAVFFGGSEIWDNTTTFGTTTGTDFGAIAQGSAAVSKLYTINNTGTAALNLSQMTLPNGFSILGILPATIAAGASASFTVQMDTSIAGIKTDQ
jgi:murein DD-endopeptidase MepM/ murein hydrolase activator NlpD